MSNKIHGYGQPQLPVTRGTPGSTEVARADGKPVEQVTPARESVSLTDTARLLGKLEEAVQKSPVSDASHVARVRDAIGRNEYVIDAQRVADKMIRHERDLAGKK